MGIVTRTSWIVEVETDGVLVKKLDVVLPARDDPRPPPWPEERDDDCVLEDSVFVAVGGWMVRRASKSRPAGPSEVLISTAVGSGSIFCALLLDVQSLVGRRLTS